MCWKWFRVLGLIACFLAFQGCSDGSSDKITDIDERVVDDTTIGDGNGTVTANEDSSLPLAPNFTRVNTELEEVSLNEHHGKVVLVDFWAT